jgi:hypothetical protein
MMKPGVKKNRSHVNSITNPRLPHQLILWVTVNSGSYLYWVHFKSQTQIMHLHDYTKTGYVSPPVSISNIMSVSLNFLRLDNLL